MISQAIEVSVQAPSAARNNTVARSGAIAMVSEKHSAIGHETTFRRNRKVLLAGSSITRIRRRSGSIGVEGITIAIVGFRTPLWVSLGIRADVRCWNISLFYPGMDRSEEHTSE